MGPTRFSLTGHLFFIFFETLSLSGSLSSSYRLVSGVSGRGLLPVSNDPPPSSSSSSRSGSPRAGAASPAAPPPPGPLRPPRPPLLPLVPSSLPGPRTNRAAASPLLRPELDRPSLSPGRRAAPSRSPLLFVGLRPAANVFLAHGELCFFYTFLGGFNT